ncbi:MAG: type I-C CRISPR-associated protein Cas8c/Csd1, partial [Bryobacteraceae bacterium]
PPTVAGSDTIDLEDLLRDMEQGVIEVIDEPNTDNAIAVFKAIGSGKALAGTPDRRLYVLGLRGNGGRAVVVDWFDVALADAYRNVLSWFDDLQIQLIFDQTRTDPKTKVRDVLQHAGTLSAPVSRWMLGKATVREGEDVPKHISAALIRAALRACPARGTARHHPPFGVGAD